MRMCGTWPLTPVITKRQLKFDENSASMRFIVAGYMRCPITAEGSFPPWSKSIHVNFQKKDWYKPATKSTYRYYADFMAEKIDSGFIIVDPANQSVELKADFTPEYDSFDLVNGIYLLENLVRMQ
jgi:hypothetical protein